MINEANRKRLDGLESNLKNWLLQLAQNKINVINDTYNNARNLKQFTVGLSVAVIALFYPTLSNVGLANNFFLGSFILFSIVTLLGLLSLILPTLYELKSMPALTDHHISELQKMIDRIIEIKKMDDNNLAGIEYNKLDGSYKIMNLGKPSLFSLFLSKYGDMGLYCLFILAFIFLELGILERFVQ